MATIFMAIDANKAKDGATQFVAATGKIKEGAKTTRTELGRVNTKMNALGKTASVAKRAIGGLFAGLGTAMILRSATQAIIQYEAAMGELKTVTGATDKEMQALNETARKLGATTRFSASQTAEALTILARMGFTATESINTVRPVLDLAVAQSIEMGQAAEITASALRQFKLEAKEASRVADVLQNTANSAGTNVLQLGEAFKMIGPLAGALGYSIEETAAALGVLGDRAIQGSMAGTNLRGIIAALMGASEDAEKTLKQMGLTLKDLDPAANSIIEIFQKLADANMTAAEATSIFGRRNVSAALAITENVARMKELKSANMEAAGSAREAAEIMDNTLKGAILSLKSAWEELMLKTGDSGYAGALQNVIHTVTGAVRIFAGMEEEVDRCEKASRLLALAIEIAGVALAGFMAKKGIMFFASLTVEIKSATTAVGLLNTALLSVISAVAGWKLGSYFYDEFKIVQEVASQVIVNLWKGWEYLKFGFAQMVAGMRIAWDGLLNTMKNAMASYISDLAAMFDKIEGMINKIPGIDDINLGASKLQSWADGLSSSANAAIGKNKWAENKKNLEEQLRLIEQVNEETFKEINVEFAGKSRKGDSLADSVVSSVTASGKAAPDMAKVSQVQGPSMDMQLNADTSALEKTREAIASIRDQDYLTRLERIESLRIYATENAATLANVAEANEALNTEIRSLERGRLNQWKIHLTKMREDSQNFGFFVAEKMTTAAQSIEDSLGNAFMRMGQQGMSFKDSMVGFARDIQNAFMQMAAKIMARQVMIAAFGGGSGGLLAGIFHEGGIVGDGGNKARVVPSAVFDNAPRYHKGLFPGEMPAILEKGETVLPKGFKPEGSSNNTPNVQINYKINIDNQSSQPVQAKAGPTRFDGREYVTDIVVSDLHRNGPISQNIQGLRLR